METGRKRSSPIAYTCFHTSVTFLTWSRSLRSVLQGITDLWREKEGRALKEWGSVGFSRCIILDPFYRFHSVRRCTGRMESFRVMPYDREIVVELGEEEVRFGYSDQMLPMDAISVRVDLCRRL